MRRATPTEAVRELDLPLKARPIAPPQRVVKRTMKKRRRSPPPVAAQPIVENVPVVKASVIR